LRHGLFIFGGWTMDRDLDRSCAMSAGTTTTINGNRLNNPNSLRFCDLFGNLFQNMGAVGSPPWQNEFKLQGAVPIHWGLVFSGSFYSNRYSEGLATGGVANNGYLTRTWTLTANSVYPANCVGCTPGARVFPAGFVLGEASETINLVAPGQVLAPRLNQLDFSLKKQFKIKEKLTIEPTVQVFNILNSNAAVLESGALGSDTSPYLPKSACTSSSPASCGLGGVVNTITNPRLMRLALMLQF